MSAIGRLSDRELLLHVERAVHNERQATAHVIALLIEVETRGLHLAEGFSSLFTYCTQALHLSEHAAYNRIETARASRRYPVILAMVRAGDVTLTSVRLLAPHLTSENHEDLLARACHKSKRDVELLVAAIHPQPDVGPTVRKLPARTDGRSATADAAASQELDAVSLHDCACSSHTPAAPPRPASVQPLSPARYKIEFTIDGETHDRLRRVQDLLRHAHPNGDVSAVFVRALALLESHLNRTKLAVTDHPRPPAPANDRSRHVPSPLKRLVWKRDGGRCAYKGRRGRCTTTAFLEYHHIVPFAAGGPMSASNIELRCRAHNQYEARIYFGRAGPPPACVDDAGQLVPERVTPG